MGDRRLPSIEDVGDVLLCLAALTADLAEVGSPLQTGLDFVLVQDAVTVFIEDAESLGSPFFGGEQRLADIDRAVPIKVGVRKAGAGFRRLRGIDPEGLGNADPKLGTVDVVRRLRPVLEIGCGQQTVAVAVASIEAVFGTHQFRLDEFVEVDHAVAVDVESLDDACRGRRAMIGRSALVLGDGQSRAYGQGDRQGGSHFLAFHVILLFAGIGTAENVARARSLTGFGSFTKLYAAAGSDRPFSITRSGRHVSYCFLMNSNHEVNMNKRVLFVLTGHDRLGSPSDQSAEKTGFHLAEAARPWQVLKAAGFETDLATPTGGKAPIDPGSYDLEDSANRAFLEDPVIKDQIDHPHAVGQLDADDYDAVYFPGGHGTMWDLPDNSEVQELVREFYESGKVVGAICHGPAALVNVTLTDGSWLVDGKDVSVFTDDEERAVEKDEIVPFLLASRLAEHGANLRPAPNFEQSVSVDDRLVTGQNPASAEALGKALRDAISESVDEAA